MTDTPVTVYPVSESVSVTPYAPGESTTGRVLWGDILGTLTDQDDLQAQLQYLLDLINTKADAVATLSNSTQDSVSIAASDFLILASNPSRRGFILENDSSTVVYVLFGTDTVTSSLKSFTMDPGDVYDVTPLGGVWTGQIRGLGVAASGSIRVTEFT